MPGFEFCKSCICFRLLACSSFSPLPAYPDSRDFTFYDSEATQRRVIADCRFTIAVAAFLRLSPLRTAFFIDGNWLRSGSIVAGSGGTVSFNRIYNGFGHFGLSLFAVEVRCIGTMGNKTGFYQNAGHGGSL